MDKINNANYCASSESTENDNLRGRFTSWLDTVLYRARLKYLENQKQKVDFVSLEAIPDDCIEDPTYYFAAVERPQNDFDFEENRLAKAFRELPLMRREVLRLLFVEEKTPEEVAASLCISANCVYQFKHQALKKLRYALEEGDEQYG